MYVLWNVLSLAIAVASIFYAVTLFKQIMAKDAGDEVMQKIARAVQEGGRAFLHAEYKWLAVFVVVVFGLLCLGSDDPTTGQGFESELLGPKALDRRVGLGVRWGQYLDGGELRLKGHTDRGRHAQSGEQVFSRSREGSILVWSMIMAQGGGGEPA